MKNVYSCRVSDGSARPDISIIVVNHKSADLTRRALAAARTAAGDLSLEEIVVDAGLAPAEVEALKSGCSHANLVLLRRAHGFASGCNEGVNVANGRFVLLLNPDAFARGEAVKRLFEVVDSDARIGVAAPIMLDERGQPQSYFHRRVPDLLTLFFDLCLPWSMLAAGRSLDPLHVPRRLNRGVRDIAHATWAVLLVRREAIESSGLLADGFFLYFEETEWQARIARAGWRIVGVADAAFVHLGGGSSEGHPFESRHYYNSICRYYSDPLAALAVAEVGIAISLSCVALAWLVGFKRSRATQLWRRYARAHRLVSMNIRRLLSGVCVSAYRNAAVAGSNG